MTEQVLVSVSKFGHFAKLSGHDQTLFPALIVISVMPGYVDELFEYVL